MRKIKTIFERDWNGNGLITTDRGQGVDMELLQSATATEKLDGTNVRITVRAKTVVRAEKRRNPKPEQKSVGIIDPWYVDASEKSPEDKWVFEGIANTDFSVVPDGEWSGELVGPAVRANPLKLETHRIVFFTIGQAPVFEDVPTDYEGLKEWLPAQKSKYGNDCGIEGIVWHCTNGEMYKIKTGDFRRLLDK